MKDEGWNFPLHVRQKSKQVHEIFSQYRNAELEGDRKLKLSSSELLGLCGLVRHLVETRLAELEDIGDELISFFAVCKVVDLLLSI